MIRKAFAQDVPQMAALSDRKRSEYEQYAPTFWRKAEDGAEKQREFFLAQLNRTDAFCLVSGQAEAVNGFLIAIIISAPPVYDPGSLVCMIDDFVVADPTEWATTGTELLQEVRQCAEACGAKLSVVVCGHQDAPKREMLRSAGFTLAAEWYVNP